MNVQTPVGEARSTRQGGLFLPLADFAKGLDLDNVPEEVLVQSRLEVLDTIGCIIAGAGEPDAARIVACERRALKGPTARLFCSDERFPVEVAARLNSYLGDVCEHNDLVGSHASIATLPSALALSDQVGANGADLLRAYIAGTEIVARLYVAYYAWKKPYTDCGIAPPGIINTIGSAAGCSLLLGLSHAQLLEAMAIGGGLSGWCPVGAVYDEGSTIKPMLHGGWPASIGVLSARYAQGGITGPVKLLESEMGLFASLASQYDEKQLRDPGMWHLANPRRKYHSACGYTHAGTDAMKALYDELGPQAIADARKITIRVPFYTHRAVAKSALPATPTESRFHLPFAAALTAIGEDGVRPEHGRELDKWLAREDLRATFEKIEIVVDEQFTHYEQCAIDMEASDGSVISREGKPPRGAPANPMTPDMVRDKFRANVALVLSETQADEYIAMVEKLDCLDTLDPLYAPFAAVAVRSGEMA